MERLTTDQLVDLCDRAGLEFRSYSGRAMYGVSCLGIDCDDMMRAIADLIEAAVGDDDDESVGLAEGLAHALRTARTDSMGLGIILYFPHHKYEREEANDD